jgi:hypothetical protein
MLIGALSVAAIASAPAPADAQDFTLLIPENVGVWSGSTVVFSGHTEGTAVGGCGGCQCSEEHPVQQVVLIAPVPGVRAQVVDAVITWQSEPVEPGTRARVDPWCTGIADFGDGGVRVYGYLVFFD